MIQFFTHVKRCPDSGTFRQLLKRNWRYLKVYLIMLDPLWGGGGEGSFTGRIRLPKKFRFRSYQLILFCLIFRDCSPSKEAVR